MTIRRVVVAVTAALLLGACVGGDDDAAAPEAPGPMASEDAAGGDPHGELACDDEVVAAIDQTIDAQLAAFADDDFATALDLASEGFQSGLDIDAFRQIIEGDYPVVADAVGHTSGICVAQEGAAQLLVTVEGADGEAQELVYTMALEDDVWRIEGATTPPGAPSAPPIV